MIRMPRTLNLSITFTNLTRRFADMKGITAKLLTVICFLLVAAVTYMQSGCARIVPPSGGPKDTLPPVLVKAVPKDSLLNMPLTNIKITLTFDEYVQLDNATTNLIVNPTLKKIPIVENVLKQVTVKIKDTLEPNTTYSLNFGNGIKDVNEGNILKNFTYVFSTGKYLDSGTIGGRVTLAKDNKVDSTLLVVLQRHLDDSAVAKETPRYTTRVDKKGRFLFRNIATGTYAIYALKDAGDKKYHDKSDNFAFYDSAVHITNFFSVKDSIFLFAYAELSTKPNTTASGANKSNNTSQKKPSKKEKEKEKLHVSTDLANGKQDLLSPLILAYDQPIKTLDTTQLRLTDTNYHDVPYRFEVVDTNMKKFKIHYGWKEDSVFKLIIGKGFATDTNGVQLGASDTLRFGTKREADYGSLRLRFKNVDFGQHPVLQFIQNDKVVDSIKITEPEFYRELYHPGEYELRVLYDLNQNMKWDPGSFFGLHKQPEMVKSPKQPKIKVRGNGWENEYDVVL